MNIANKYVLLLRVRVANHNLYGCFQSAFENADLCSCATSQVEEAVQYIHGFETDYSRHMNMHCQGTPRYICICIRFVPGHMKVVYFNDTPTHNFN